MESSFAYLSTELEVLGGAENYYRWVLSRFAPYLGKRTIEVGAGIDTFSRSPLSCGQIAELVLIEPGDNLFPPLKTIFRGAPGKVLQGYLPELTTSLTADPVVLVNVLEHIAGDDVLL